MSMSRGMDGYRDIKTFENVRLRVIRDNRLRCSELGKRYNIHCTPYMAGNRKINNTGTVVLVVEIGRAEIRYNIAANQNTAPISN